MSDIIHLLPDSVANQIAAGEVIQRPASVIKELVENAVDAGATEISIYIKDAGRTLIQVIDNGRGMSETDARMAFERHATSKIRQADDLFTLRSMGFRGEALPSICAISQVEMRTRPKEAEMGTRILINGSRVESQEPDLCEAGTNISVRNLFFNVPARRKFLKSDTVELSNIMREFERLALVNNRIRMRIDTGAKTIDLMGGTFRQRIEGIWKNSLKAELVPVEIDTTLVKISGFLSRPEYARRRNPLQFLIANGRNMRHPYFHKAILSCYESLIAADTQPCYFLKFEVDPASIDVNIHPTKNEIKFEYESEIWKLLTTAVKSALGMNSGVPSIDFDNDILPVETLAPGEHPVAPDSSFQSDYNPFRAAASQRSRVPSDWQKLYDGFMKDSYPSSPALEEDAEEESLAKLFAGTVASSLGERKGNEALGHSSLIEEEELQIGSSRICMQIGLKYIAVSSREGLILIDQYRAHLRILYERILRERNLEAEGSQSVLFPEVIILDPQQQAILSGVLLDLEAMGYRLNQSDGSAGEWEITGIPLSGRNEDSKDVIMRILDSLTEEGPNYGSDALPAKAMKERKALMLARSSAVAGGRRLSEEEMEHLVAELFRLPDPALTPDGHRIYTLLDFPRLESLLP